MVEIRTRLKVARRRGGGEVLTGAMGAGAATLGDTGSRRGAGQSDESGPCEHGHEEDGLVR